jgi:folate-binding protein YgfZ
MKAAFLSDRGVVKVAGSEARKFLNGLLTADMGKVGPGRPAFAGLLTPQGKIIVDFIVAEAADASFLFDCPRALAPALAERLAFYKLRAKLTIEDQSASLHVIAAWNDAAAAAAAPDLCFPDPRHAELGMRCISPRPPAEVAAALGATLVEASAYEHHRIMLGVPSGGLDFAYGDAFPHEADMDQLNGIDFKKGCFVGQEVVSRMEHRGLARTRVVPVALTGAAPVVGTAVTAGGKPVGVMGGAAGSRALAALRLDRVEEALAGGQHLRAGDAELKLVKPAWARFAFPGEPKAAE